MPGNKRGFDDPDSEYVPSKRTRATGQGDGIRTIQPAALSMALPNNRVYTPNPLPIALPTPAAPPQMPIATSPRNLTLEMPGAASSSTTNHSPFGATYHHTGAPHPFTTRFSNLSGLRFGDHPIEHFNIKIPDSKSGEDKAALKAKMEAEMQRQKENAPALPKSKVAQLPPKEHVGEPIPFPTNGTPEEQQAATQYNDWLSSEIQRVDRERNNQAAKKSRLTRLESLDVTREILNRAAAERDWLRLKVIQLGGDLQEWDGLSQQMKQKAVQMVDGRVKAVAQVHDAERKRDEAYKRAERNRQKQEAQRVAQLAQNAKANANSTADANDEETPRQPAPQQHHPHHQLVDPQLQHGDQQQHDQQLLDPQLQQHHHQTQQQQHPHSSLVSFETPELAPVLPENPETTSFFDSHDGLGIDDGGFLGNMDFLSTP